MRKLKEISIEHLIAKYTKDMKYGSKDCLLNREDEAAKSYLEELVSLRAQFTAFQQESNRMAKAFALLCRVLDDFAGLPPCQVRQMDWPECNGESEQCGNRPLWQCWQKYILEQVDAEPVCRVCGCTQHNACPGGCYWVEPDLCSACAESDGPQEAGKETT